MRLPCRTMPDDSLVRRKESQNHRRYGNDDDDGPNGSSATHGECRGPQNGRFIRSSLATLGRRKTEIPLAKMGDLTQPVLVLDARG